MKKQLLLLLFLSLVHKIFAQQSPTFLKGKITDKETEQPLFGASIVVVKSTSTGTTTDANGNFLLTNVPAEKQLFSISYIGYEELLVEVDIVEGVVNTLFASLQPKLTELQEIIVTNKLHNDSEPLNTMAVISARSFSVDQSERFAASLRDPARLALSFPGVKPQADIVNGIIVRGNAPKGVLWRVEGVEVPDPNHFSQEGYGGGAVSMISGEVISTSDFYSGAFPAEFGNAMSAVFDVRLRKGSTDKKRYSLYLGMLGLEASTEGPFKKNGTSSYIVNYRYSTLAVLEKTGMKIGNTVTAYQDLNFKLNFPTAHKGVFSVFAIGGLSKLTITEQRTKKDVEKRKNYDMGVIGVDHTFSINEKNLLKTTISVAANREALDKDEFFYALNTSLTDYRIGASNIYVRKSLQLDTRLSARSSLRSGITGTFVRFRLFDTFFDVLQNSSSYRSKGSTYILQGFTHWKYDLTEKLTVLSGLHLLYFGLNGNYGIEPRMSLKYQLNEKNAFQLAAGLHSRLESLSTYMVEDPQVGERPNEQLDLTKAAHFGLGYEIIPLKHVTVKTELFFQYLYHVPISVNPNSSFSMLNFIERYTLRKLENKGKGMNYGVELSVEKSFSKNYYLLWNGTLFNSKYYAADGQWRNTRFNAHYITSLTAGKDFPFGKITKQWIFGLNMRLLFSGGERKWESEFAGQYDDYFRLDTRVSLSRKRPNLFWQFAIDLQNTTNRLNESSLEDIDPVGILPVASFKISF